MAEQTIRLQVQVDTDELCETLTEQAIREARAEAWDEGFDAGHEAARCVQPEYPDSPTNPYREAGR